MKFDPSQSAVRDLAELLSVRNGFFAFESALHVFQYEPASSKLDLSAWNSFDCWKSHYGDLVPNGLFFAEDVFGDQFYIGYLGVYQFITESSESVFLSATLDGWAFIVLRDYNVLTGWELAHEWQLIHGPISDSDRLCARKR